MTRGCQSGLGPGSLAGETSSLQTARSHAASGIPCHCSRNGLPKAGCGPDRADERKEVPRTMASSLPEDRLGGVVFPCDGSEAAT